MALAAMTVAHATAGLALMGAGSVIACIGAYQPDVDLRIAAATWWMGVGGMYWASVSHPTPAPSLIVRPDDPTDIAAMVLPDVR